MNMQKTDKTVFGFWLYLMTDCVLFAALFATYAVLRGGTAGGPTGAEIFNPQFVLIETLILLVSSFTCGMAILAARKGSKNGVLGWLAVTFVLGLSFLAMELSEFAEMVHAGHSWQTSAFLSAFFTLVGTHGLHIAAGLMWIFVVVSQIAQDGLKPSNIKRLTLLSMFWHFLDVVWIFIFSIVYMMGIA